MIPTKVKHKSIRQLYMKIEWNWILYHVNLPDTFEHVNYSIPKNNDPWINKSHCQKKKNQRSTRHLEEALHCWTLIYAIVINDGRTSGTLLDDAPQQPQEAVRTSFWYWRVAGQSCRAQRDLWTQVWALRPISWAEFGAHWGVQAAAESGVISSICAWSRCLICCSADMNSYASDLFFSLSLIVGQMTQI